ncbi:YncE family protein [Streptomyces niveus]|uniref:YncE family protein n=1 Tax=Streptomyces niveus TaxID=193462 RepID=UPI00366785E7
MPVLLCSADTVAGQVGLVVKDGPSAYRWRGAVCTGRGPLAVAGGGGGVAFVALSVSDEVLVLDLVRGRVAGRVRVGWAPRGVAAVAGTPYLLVSCAGSDALSVVEVEAGREVVRLGVGREPGALAVSDDARAAFVCERGAGSVAVLDLTGLLDGRPERVRVVSRTGLGAHAQPRGLVEHDGHLLVACRLMDVLPVVEVASGRVVDSVGLPVPGSGPASVLAVGNGFALVTLERAGVVAVVDLLEWSVTRLIAVGGGPRGLTGDPADRTVYVALARQRSVAVVHLDGVDLSNEDGIPQFEDIAVGAGPSGVTVVRTDLLLPESG